MKLLIADDEDYTREGLIESIHWSRLGIHEVMQARNGNEALKIAGWYQPDIILTDVKMPKMDGIEFANEVLRIHPEVKVIFISGYLETGYLKSAIKLSAIDYIEKPIELSAVEAAVLRAAGEIRDKRDIILIKENQKELQEQKLAAMLANKKNDLAIRNALCEAVAFPMHQHYVCMILWDRSSQSIEQVQRAIREYVESKKFYVLTRYIDESHYQILIAFEKGESYRLMGLYQGIAGLADAYVLGVGFEAIDLANIYNSFQTAAAAVHNSFFDQKGKVFFLDQIVNKKVIEPGLFREFLQMLKEDPFALRAWCEEFFLEVKQHRCYKKEQVQTLAVSLVSALLEEYPLVREQYSQLDTAEDIEQCIRGFGTLEAIEQQLYELIAQVENCCKKQSRYSRVTAGVMEYISANYTRVELSVSEIAEHFHLTPAYLNVIFKQETGLTLKKQISNVRLEHAKQLLRADYDKVTEIAEKCGYANANYFAKVFREEEELTPLEYRNQVRGEKKGR